MNRTADILVIGAGPGGLSAAATLALHGRNVVVISDGHLMGYGIEGAFKSKAGFEIARLYAHATLRQELFEIPSAPKFGAVEQGIERAAIKGNSTYRVWSICEAGRHKIQVTLFAF